MAETLSPEELRGEQEVSEARLGRLRRRELRDRLDIEWEVGQSALRKMVRGTNIDVKIQRRLRILRAAGAGRVFLAAVSDKSGIVCENGDWLDFLKRIIEWLMSEEGQEFIQFIIDLVMTIIGLF